MAVKMNLSTYLRWVFNFLSRVDSNFGRNGEILEDLIRLLT